MFFQADHAKISFIMSHFPESDPAKAEVLAQTPILKYFYFLPRHAELAENPQYRRVIQTQDRYFTEHIGYNWREHYLPIIKHFDDSFKALHNKLSPDGKEDCMLLLLFVGFELGPDNVSLFVEDVQTRMDNMNLLDYMWGPEHDGRRGHDFVEAVMRIGADIRKDHPLKEEPPPADKSTKPVDLLNIPEFM